MLELLLMVVLQSMVVNPRSVVFSCPDHALDTGHEIDIVNASGAVIQTIQGGDPAADGNGDVTVSINVQPVAFGSYTVRVRATAGDVESLDSVASDVWQRAPGQPGKPRVGG
jgi:hypothetical protein